MPNGSLGGSEGESEGASASYIIFNVGDSLFISDCSSVDKVRECGGRVGVGVYSCGCSHRLLIAKMEPLLPVLSVGAPLMSLFTEWLSCAFNAVSIHISVSILRTNLPSAFTSIAVHSLVILGHSMPSASMSRPRSCAGTDQVPPLRGIKRSPPRF